jgi:hypothetical protein
MVVVHLRCRAHCASSKRGLQDEFCTFLLISFLPSFQELRYSIDCFVYTHELSSFTKSAQLLDPIFDFNDVFHRS